METDDEIEKGIGGIVKIVLIGFGCIGFAYLISQGGCIRKAINGVYKADDKKQESTHAQPGNEFYGRDYFDWISITRDLYRRIP